MFIALNEVKRNVQSEHCEGEADSIICKERAERR